MRKVPPLAALIASLLCPAAISAKMPPVARTAQILRRLDLTSFPNAVRPRAQSGRHTPRDYGLTRFHRFPDGWVEATEPDGGWHISALLLERTAATVTICFRDTGGNGASYRATAVLRLSPTAAGLWSASQIPDRYDCRNDPPLAPGRETAPRFIAHHAMPDRP